MKNKNSQFHNKMSKKEKSLASQALLEMKNIQGAIREESKNTLKDLLSEAVKDALRDSALDDDSDDDDMEIEEPEDNADNKGEKKPAAKRKSSGEEVSEGGNPLEQPEGAEPQETPQEMPQEMPNGGAENVPQPGQAEGNGAEDEWSQFDEYQTGDEGTYDLTSEKDFGKVLKVYKLLNNDDDIVVKQDGNKVELQDNNSGAEYIIDLGDEGEEPMAEAVPGEEGEEMQAELNEENVFEVETDDVPDPEEDDFYDDIPSFGEDDDYDDEGLEDDDEGLEDDDFPIGQPSRRKHNDYGFDDDEIAGFGGDLAGIDDILESKKRNNKRTARKPMKEGKKNEKEVLFEIDLGYTDNYQDKDPIKGLSNNEPSKSGRSWHKGVPTGTEKPWAGETKTKGDPFKKTQKVEGSVNEEVDELEEEPVEEATNVGGAVQQRSNSKSHIPANREGNTPKVTRHASVGGDYKEKLEESLRKLQKENKMLKEGVKELRKGLNEAHVVNVSLGKITKLFLENTTSAQEKKEIVNRFANEAKTVEQSQALYESISKQLNSNYGEKKTINEQAIKAESNPINESKNVPSEFNGMIDLMKRMGNY